MFKKKFSKLKKYTGKKTRASEYFANQLSNKLVLSCCYSTC